MPQGFWICIRGQGTIFSYLSSKFWLVCSDLFKYVFSYLTYIISMHFFLTFLSPFRIVVIVDLHNKQIAHIIFNTSLTFNRSWLSKKSSISIQKHKALNESKFLWCIHLCQPSCWPRFEFQQSLISTLCFFKFVSLHW